MVRNASPDEAKTLDLTDQEKRAINIGGALSYQFSGPRERAETEYLGGGPGDDGWDEESVRTRRLAVRLGFDTEAELENESERLDDAIRSGAPLTFEDWKTAIRIIARLMSPDDSEWEIVLDISYLQTAEALESLNRKVDLAFGGSWVNPMPDGSHRH